MARKEDKLRPYRVDWFDVPEMVDVDRVQVNSIVIRAVTADDAVAEVLGGADCEQGRFIIKAHRFYKQLRGRKAPVYKNVEDLFPPKKAIKVMELVEEFRLTGKRRSTGPDSPETVAVVKDLNGMLAHDEHEQAMDTFVPSTPVPEGLKPGLGFPDHPVVPTKDAVFDDGEMTDLATVLASALCHGSGSPPKDRRAPRAA